MGEAPVVAETMDLDTVTVLRAAAAGEGNLGWTLMREAGAVGDGQYGGGGTAWGTEKKKSCHKLSSTKHKTSRHACRVC